MYPVRSLLNVFLCFYCDGGGVELYGPFYSYVDRPEARPENFAGKVGVNVASGSGGRAINCCLPRPNAELKTLPPWPQAGRKFCLPGRRPAEIFGCREPPMASDLGSPASIEPPI